MCKLCILDDIRSQLKKWAIEQNVSHKQLNTLLPILRNQYKELPLCSKTILCTVRNLNITKMMSSRDTEGEYIYFGIKNALNKEFDKGAGDIILNNKERNIIQLILNIDGLPIHKSTSIQFWPILGAIYASGQKLDVFDVAIYTGDSKPKYITEFLKDVTTEINALIENGFMYKNKTYFVKLKAFICDAPARSFLKCIKAHNSFHGCEFCTIIGHRVDGRTIFSNTSINVVEARTNESFRQQIDEDHHNGTSPLTLLKEFDIVKGVPLDYMHMACLGTMRRLLNYWFKSTSKFCVAAAFRKEASKRLLSVSPYIPKEFNRKPRTLIELDRWKASELRTFLLYLGPFILKDLISLRQYKHFLCLHSALRICCNSQFENEIGQKAIDLIKQFSDKSGEIYTPEEPVYNTHSLIHLVESAVKQKESLEEVNCFQFENHLGHLKRLLRTPNKPLQQVCKRLFEKDDIIMKYKRNDKITKIYFKNSLLIKAVIYRNMEICTDNNADSYILLKNEKIMKVKEILEEENGDTFLKGYVFQHTCEAFFTPISSKLLNIFSVKNLGTYVFTVNIHEFQNKCMVFPIENSYFALSLLHLNW